ncbi:MAG: hypothetical protein MJ168_05855 [Clostridia bacterium]|nr:hypothetical protein [Clostridia bacterium]
MKKTASVLLTFFMLFVMILPCAAANQAKFSVNIVSESDTELVVSLDYDGGSSFQNFDFELKYNADKLKAKEAYDGDGSAAFQMYAKKNGGNAISIVNKDINPIKGAFAVTVPFKVVQGKDMFIFSFQKLSKQSVTKGDISVAFTTCQLNDANVQVTVSLPFADGSPNGTVSGSSSALQKSEAATADTELVTADASDSIAQTEEDAESEELIAKNEESIAEDNSNPAKKIVWVVAAALCMVIIITGVIVFLRKKNIEE